jgi:FkbM family methyltransferase
MNRGFGVRPTSTHPLNLVAFAATRAGSALNRRLGRYGFNSVRRLTGDALASQTLKATSKGDVLLFPAIDSYYCELFLEERDEPEIFHLLASVREEPYAFIDGGANLGFWSVQVSGALLGSHPCVAIEASSPTFRLLERNCLENHNRFICLHAAVHRSSGELLAFDESAEHAARHVVRNGGAGSAVVSVTIDDVIERFFPEVPTVIVKLDVEGAEPDALAGGTRCRRDRDCLFIVEDHGSDGQHRTAAACLAQGLMLWLLGPSGTATPMPDLDSVARVKTCRKTGYNFVASERNSRLARRLGLTPEVARRGEIVRLRQPSGDGKVALPFGDGR